MKGTPQEKQTAARNSATGGPSGVSSKGSTGGGASGGVKVIDQNGARVGASIKKAGGYSYGATVKVAQGAPRMGSTGVRNLGSRVPSGDSSVFRTVSATRPQPRPDRPRMSASSGVPVQAGSVTGSPIVLGFPDLSGLVGDPSRFIGGNIEQADPTMPGVHMYQEVINPDGSTSAMPTGAQWELPEFLGAMVLNAGDPDYVPDLISRNLDTPVGQAVVAGLGGAAVVSGMAIGRGVINQHRSSVTYAQGQADRAAREASEQRARIDGIRSGETAERSGEGLRQRFMSGRGRGGGGGGGGNLFPSVNAAGERDRLLNLFQ